MPDDTSNPTPDEAFAMLRGDGYASVFVELAVMLAASPDITEFGLRYATGAETPSTPLPERPAHRRWIRLYRNHRRLQDAFGDLLGVAGDESASDFVDAARKASTADPETIAAEVAEWSVDEQRAFLLPFMGVPFPPDETTLPAILRDVEADHDAEDPVFDALADSPEGQFYFRVWFPCWVLYRDYPPRLLRTARLGDLDALDRLLRLDKYAVGDPGISRRIAEVMSAGTAGERKQIQQALDGKPRKQITPKAIRSGLGALISQAAILFGKPVTAPQIGELFDRIERIRSGNPADPHIPAGESLTKAIKRNKTWPSLPTD